MEITENFSLKKVRPKSKSSHRLLFEAQVEVIKREIGGLEEVREKLGLSRRKIAQLLMVDPSAWTRWTKPGESAPPHIYRALQWYLLMSEKYPGLGTPYWLSSKVHGTAVPAASPEEIQALKEELADLREKWAKTTEKPQKTKEKQGFSVRLQSYWPFFLALAAFSLGYLLK